MGIYITKRKKNTTKLIRNIKWRTYQQELESNQQNVDVISKHGEVESGEEHLQNLAVHQNVDHELMDHLEVRVKQEGVAE